MTLPYRDFLYPLNVFMHILTHEEGSVPYLHYGLFEREGEPLQMAQERSTQLLLARLPPPPAALLEVGTGPGTTLERLTTAGYHVIGITPDAQQVAMVQSAFGDRVDVRCVSFERFESGKTFDAIVFQESSQYIDSEVLFAQAARLTGRVLVIDEFATGGAEGLHRYDAFRAAAEGHGFHVSEELDLSSQAAPTIDYFRVRLPRYRDRLVTELGITDQQVDDLISSGERYAASYERGDYGYRLLDLKRRG